jgi:hypothetical protein
MGDDPSFQARKYNLLRHALSDKAYPSFEEIEIINNARKGANLF